MPAAIWSRSNITSRSAAPRIRLDRHSGAVDPDCRMEMHIHQRHARGIGHFRRLVFYHPGLARFAIRLRQDDIRRGQGDSCCRPLVWVDPVVSDAARASPVYRRMMVWSLIVDAFCRI